MKLMTIMNILFVCTQNVFRSLSAHKITEKYLKDNNIAEYKIDSAGTIAHSWESPYSHTLYKLKELGISDLKHTNKKVTKQLVNWANIIIVMTHSHKEYIESNFGSKAYLFNELAHNRLTDLEDDVETDLLENGLYNLEDFIAKTIDHINDGVPKIINKIDKNN